MKKIKWLILLSCLLILVTPVCANPLERIYTKFIFQQDDAPVNDVINFTLNCYNESSISVFSHAESCLPDDCGYFGYTSYEWAKPSISYCNIEGSYQGRSFSRKNISPKTMAEWYSVEYLGEYGEDRVYLLTRNELDSCRQNAEIKKHNECDGFLKPAKEEILYAGYSGSDLFNNGTLFYETSEYIQCDLRVDSERNVCYESYPRITNDSKIYMKFISQYPSYYTKIRVDISAENNTPQTSFIPGDNFSVPNSPVASLYCNFLNIFGMAC